MDMTRFPAHITTEGGALLAEVEAWIEKVQRGSLYEWHGGFELPAAAKLGVNDLMSSGTLGIKLSDGRSGKIFVTNLEQHWDIPTHPDNAPADVQFQGTGPLE